MSQALLARHHFPEGQIPAGGVKRSYRKIRNEQTSVVLIPGLNEPINPWQSAHGPNCLQENRVRVFKLQERIDGDQSDQNHIVSCG